MHTRDWSIPGSAWWIESPICDNKLNPKIFFMKWISATSGERGPDSTRMEVLLYTPAHWSDRMVALRRAKRLPPPPAPTRWNDSFR
jgi:hypothetical protein